MANLKSPGVPVTMVDIDYWPPEAIAVTNPVHGGYSNTASSNGGLQAPATQGTVVVPVGTIYPGTITIAAGNSGNPYGFAASGGGTIVTSALEEDQLWSMDDVLPEIVLETIIDDKEYYMILQPDAPSASEVLKIMMMFLSWEGRGSYNAHLYAQANNLQRHFKYEEIV